MNLNLKQLSKKYDLTVNDFDNMYYETFRVVRKLSGPKLNEELLNKFLSDKLEENGIGYRDIEKIVEYYINEPETEENEDEESLDEDEAQTSDNTGINSDIGMNRKTGYKTKVIEPYT